MKIADLPFKEIWIADFEFFAPDGHVSDPICLVSKELRSGKTLRLARDDLSRAGRPPYPTGPESLFVAYMASAESSCHLALGWPLPEQVLDLYVEFRALTNGRDRPAGSGLLGALTYFGLDGIGAAEKQSMRELAMRGGPWMADEQEDLLAYCETDVVALEHLLPVMLPHMTWPYPLLRGRYMRAVARMERLGVPIDVETFSSLRGAWPHLQERLVAQVDRSFGVFDGTTFKQARFAAWLASRGISWPRLASGKLALDDETFKIMTGLHPVLLPLHQLRGQRAKMRTIDLTVGPDGRNRTSLFPFSARSGRNAPSTTKSIFAAPSWVRNLITPTVGNALAYIDWSQQEFGIAAKLSTDPAMMEAYCSGDPYLRFAVQAGAAPPDATKNSHGRVRDIYKQCVLGLGYGMKAGTLALRTGLSVPEAAELLTRHRLTYPRFWAWSDSALDHANLCGRLYTVFDWSICVGARANPRSLRNFPVQANAAEMLRLAACFLTEAGIRVCAPVHDAFLIEAPLTELEHTVVAAQALMARASAVVLDGFELRSDAKLIRYPDRFVDERGTYMWNLVNELLAEERAVRCAPLQLDGVHQCNTGVS